MLARTEAPDAPARVLLIVIDALRPDRLGAYGYDRDTSPNLDQFARESRLYRNALSVAPWTKPSIASLLTGLYPRRHGVAHAGWNKSEGDEAGPRVAVLSRKLLTFPEILADAGYRTAAFGANHHLVARLGLDGGFEAHEMSLTDSGGLQTLARRLGLGFAKHLSTAPDAGHLGAARRINERLLDWLPEGDQPFFAYLHHINVHWPYEAAGAVSPAALVHGEAAWISTPRASTRSSDPNANSMTLRPPSTPRYCGT